MNVKRHFEKAIQFRVEMESHLDAINTKLRQSFGDEITLFYQAGDGWCILFDENANFNAMVSPSELEQLFAMTKENAIAFLKSKSI
jgi:hypothetical protein